MKAIKKRRQRRSDKTNLALMSSLVIVFAKPNVKVNLKLLKRLTNFLSKCHLIKLIENRAMKSLADPICLGMPDFRSGVLDVAHLEIELEIMGIRLSTVFSAAVGKNSKQGRLKLIEEGDDLFVEQIGGCDGRFSRVELADGDLRIGIDQGLLVNSANALEAAEVEGVL